MTHHKAQGKTIFKACVNPKALSEGQAYVALSRTRSFEDLHLLEKCRKSDIKMSVESELFLEQHDDPEMRKKIDTWRDKPLPSSEKINNLRERSEKMRAAGF